MRTTLLRSGKVIDGTGNLAFDGHILIEGDRIKAVLKEKETLPSADTVINATGYAITPGFIDVHSHMDWMLPLDNHPKLLKCLLEQGITTLVGGNCGFSPAPLRMGESRLEHSFAVFAPAIQGRTNWNWHSMGEFLQRIEEIKPIVNLAQLVGHATIRIGAAETERGTMKPGELQNCLEKLQQSLEEGACGLSFGLGYDPGMFSQKEEIETFSAVAAKARKPIAVHLKAYSRLSPFYPLTYLKPHNLLALKEMIDTARRTRVALQVSHFMVAYRRTWPMAEECLRIIEDARNEGIDIMIDAFPYTYGNTTVVAALLPWFIAKLPEAYENRWARTMIRIEYMAGPPLTGWSPNHMQLMDAGVEGWEDLSGLTIGEIAHKWKTSSSDVLLKLSKSSQGRAAILYHGLSGEPSNEKPLDTILSHDLCLFETDTLIRGGGYPNPATFGAFPKILGYHVRERKLFSIENAIKRMTSASADRFALRDRGRLEPGKAADIVIFDPQSISETPAIGRQPAGKPVGIHHVFLNGVHVVKDGTYVSVERAGRVLRI